MVCECDFILLMVGRGGIDFGESRRITSVQAHIM